MPNVGPILLTGSRGQVGSELLPLLQKSGTVIAPTRTELDLTDTDAVRRFIRSTNPRWIVNAAAYTAVDKAESEPEKAFIVNRDVPRVLGEEAVRLGSAVVHISTDYVFSGEGTIPWQEDDPTAPLSVYGASKRAGEEDLASSGAAHFIFRTSWVYGAVGHNFLLTIYRLARQRHELKIVDDQHGAPTWSKNIARLIAGTVQRYDEQSVEVSSSLADSARAVSGVYHACDAGFTTWFGFAREFLNEAQRAKPGQPLAELIPIATSEYPTPARRPQNSRLNCNKLAQVLGFKMPPWQESMAKVMQDLLAGE